MPEGNAAGTGPSGTVTFLFTDIEGSTKRWERDRVAMGAAVARHDRLVRSVVESFGGHVFKTVGDAFCTAFTTAPVAVAAALATQRAISSEDWSLVDGLRVRMALHTGISDERDGDYFGPTVNRTARLLAIGHGGQVLVSSVAAGLVRERMPAGATLLELGRYWLKDLSDPERVSQLLTSDLPSDFPALSSVDAIPNNLPLQVTSFVGRDSEVSEIVGCVRKNRLVTLVGSGGIGKTRTSLQVGANLLGEFADGVWLVELAPIVDPALVPEAIAMVLHVQIPTGGDPIALLAKSLKHRELLLLLDNCEHLVDAIARSVEGLLLTCPRVRVLASSRQRLAIAGEAMYRLPSLALPDAASVGLSNASDAIAYGAIALFVARAEAADSRFVFTDDAAPIVADICRRLDGVALAIELAAARVNVIDVRQLRHRLDERFRILTGGSRTALPRQQTLRALIDWSYDLLDGRERALFRRLGIFVDAFALEAAVAFGDDETLDATDVFDVLAALVEKSLVVPTIVGDATRYRLLESTRAYAYEKLAAAGETERYHERRFSYLLDLFERAEARYDESGREASVYELRHELDDARSAIEWAVATGRAERAAALATASSVLQLLGLYTEMGGLARRLQDVVDARLLRPHGRLRFMSAYAAARNGQMALATELCATAIDAARASGDRDLLGEASILYARAIASDARTAEATAALDEAESSAPVTPRRHAAILNARSIVASCAGDAVAAIDFAERSMALHRSLGNRSASTIAAIVLAEQLHQHGETSRAIEIALEGIERSREDYAPFRRSKLVSNLSAYYLAVGDVRSACVAIAEAIDLYEAHRPDAAQFSALFLYVALVSVAHGDIDDASRAFGYSERLHSERGFTYESTEIDARERLVSAIARGSTATERCACEREGAAWSDEHAHAFAKRVCMAP